MSQRDIRYDVYDLAEEDADAIRVWGPPPPEYDPDDEPRERSAEWKRYEKAIRAAMREEGLSVTKHGLAEPGDNMMATGSVMWYESNEPAYELIFFPEDVEDEDEEDDE